MVAFVRLNPNYRAEAAAFLDEAVERGARGLKLHPTTTLAHPADEPTVALLRRCGELGVPALFHCGDDPYTTPQTFGTRRPRPRRTARSCSATWVATSMSRKRSPSPRPTTNLYLETSAMPYPPLIRTAVERVGPRRVLFGSDGPGCNPALELDKVRQAGLSADDEALVLGGNAARLLKVST